MNADGHIIARMDQASEDAKQTARPVSAFYKQLIADGMNEGTAREIAVLYARKLLTGKV